MKADYLESGQIFSCVFVRLKQRVLLVHVDRVPVFSRESALRMRELYQTCDWTFEELSQHFDVNRHLVNEVLQGVWVGIRKLGLPRLRRSRLGVRQEARA